MQNKSAFSIIIALKIYEDIIIIHHHFLLKNVSDWVIDKQKTFIFYNLETEKSKVNGLVTGD